MIAEKFKTQKLEIFPQSQHHHPLPHTQNDPYRKV